MKISAVVVAAGSGARAGGGVPKQFRTLGDRPVLAHALLRVAGHPGIGPSVVVIPPGMGPLFEDSVRPWLGGMDVRPVEGGRSRAESVRAGLEALATLAPDFVLIHDGARPLPSRALIGRVCDALPGGAAAAPAVPVADALWRGGDGLVAGTLSRENLWRAQTPQGFAYPAILAAHARHDGEAADDVEVARAAGIDVAIVEGEEDNMKITRPEDFARAARLLETGMDVRVGNGFDVHAFTPGDAVILCGVRIPHDCALSGHSDADVAFHALADAIYGALGEGDIGRWFPPSDPQWRGAASDIFLRHAGTRAAARGYALSALDVTLVCEAPRIGPHAEAMRARTAEVLGIAPDRISIKATTSEKLGFTGRGEGIAALATATLTGWTR